MKTPNFKFSQILFTTNYGMFKALLGNRDLSSRHVDELVESFQEEYLFSPIIVNEKFQVIDGQHRLEACKKLGLPVYYIVVQGYGMKEIQRFNQNTNNWMNKDFLKSYCDKKVEPYIEMRKFMECYPSFGMKTTLVLMNLNKNTGQVKNYLTLSKEFENGRLHIVNLKHTYEIAKKLMEYQEFFDAFNQHKFIVALIALFKNPNFLHEEFIKKLRIQPGALQRCANGEQYRSLVEDIYNYKRKDKVNLRF